MNKKSHSLKGLYSLLLAVVIVSTSIPAFPNADLTSVSTNDVANTLTTEAEATDSKPEARIVKYKVLYVDEQGKELSYPVTKIDFQGEKVKEKGVYVKDYEPIDNFADITVNERMEIKFVYKSTKQ